MHEKHFWKDKAVTVRKGEELDLNKLKAYLKNKLPGLQGDLEVLQFPSGFSNLTYLIKSAEQEFVLRRPPFGAKVKSGHDMGREFKILSALYPHYKQVPKAIHFAQSSPVMDCPFYIMERVEGVILRNKMPEEMQPSPEEMTEIAKSFVSTFVKLHQLDYEKIGLDNLGRPLGYADRQISGWTKRYLKAKTDEVPEVDALTAYLEHNKPETSETSLIHNDFKYDNLVLDPNDWTKVRAILDWEMCTLGDPLMDLGTSLAYWINHDDPDWMKAMALNPTTLKGNPTRMELLELYEQESGQQVEHPIFYYVYGLFKIIGITQQIYYRYKNGHTQDPRFARLDKVVKGLAKVAMRAINKNEI